MAASDHAKLSAAIKTRMRAEVFASGRELEICSRDYSVYRARPQVVVVPHCEEDITAVVRFAAEHGIPVTGRGGGSRTSGSGNLHLCPLFDTASRDLPRMIQRVADAVYDVVLKYDGTITTEHGMVPIRAPYLEREWGTTICGYMRAVKKHSIRPAFSTRGPCSRYDRSRMAWRRKVSCDAFSEERPLRVHPAGE